MSKYTTELRFICENYSGLDESVGYNDTQTVIQKAIPKIFDFGFPIFDENYRNVLERKIITHYYTREIGFETVGLWKLKLYTKLNEIMPYYNKLYESELIKFNPLYDVDLTRDHNKQGSGNNAKQGTGSSKNNGSLTSNNSNWDFYSDTPQGNIYDFPGESHDNTTNEMTYLTNARKDVGNRSDTTANTSTANTSESGNFSNTEDYLEHVKGKNPGRSYASLIKEYREIFLNIDMDIINDLSDLFMLLW